jgi:hypothetical protein
VVLRQARFVVWESGRRRFLRGDRRRRIHSWVDGYLAAWPDTTGCEYVDYDPRRGTFVGPAGGVVTEAPLVLCDDIGWMFVPGRRKALAVAKPR